jgi:hypothetical protein
MRAIDQANVHKSLLINKIILESIVKENASVQRSRCKCDKNRTCPEDVRHEYIDCIHVC